MKFWIKAIWAHLKPFLGELATALIAAIVALVLGGIVIGAITLLLVFLISIIGVNTVLIILLAILIGMIIFAIACGIRKTYRRVKATKERLERESNG